MSRESDVDNKGNELDEYARGFLKPIACGIAGLIIGAIAGGSDGAIVGGAFGSFVGFMTVLFFAKEC